MIKILTIGAGGLQRALTHKFIHELNKLGKYDGKIFVGQSIGKNKADAFNEQNGHYHLVTFEHETIRSVEVISSVVGATSISSDEGLELFYAKTKNKLDLILVGVTEAGVVSGDIAMNVLAETLYRYFCHHGSESTICVINTDNIKNNGTQLKNIIVNDYPKPDDNYSRWLDRNVGFLNEIGDRIVPNADTLPLSIRNKAKELQKFPDKLTTFTEQLPSMSLIIQDSQKLLRVPFSELSELGVIVTPEPIDSYHRWKLLLANAVHIPGITHKGMLSDIETVQETANHPEFGKQLDRLMAGYAKIVETDVPIEGKSALAYTNEFVNRIRKIGDSNDRVNISETIKLRDRATDIIRSKNYETSGTQFQNDFAFSVATVLRFLTPHEIIADRYFGRSDRGTKYEIRDKDRRIQNILTGAFGSTLEEIRQRLGQIFSDRELWSSPEKELETIELSLNRDFISRLAKSYHRLVNNQSCLEQCIALNRHNSFGGVG